MDDNRSYRLDGRLVPLTNHGHVVRMALFHSFWAVILGGFICIGLYKIVLVGDSGFLIMLSIGLLFGLLVGHQALEYLRDLGATPVVLEGEVLRKWMKNNPLAWSVPLGSALGGIIVYRILAHNDISLTLAFVAGAAGFILGWRLLLPPLEQFSTALSEPTANPLRRIVGGVIQFVLLPSFYIVVEAKILTVTWTEFAGLLEDDLVRVTCYPHSLTIERVERYDKTERQFVPAVGGASL